MLDGDFVILGLGEEIVAANPLEGGSARLKVVSAHFVDPEGGRLRD